MKLLTRTNLYYILFSVITYVIIAVSFYAATEFVIYKEVDERLLVESRDFENFIDMQGFWEESCYFVEDKIDINELGKRPRFEPFFTDTILFNRYDNEDVPFREYNFVSSIAGKDHHVTIRKSLIESNELLTFITVTMLVVLTVGYSLLYLFQRRISKTIWKPFFETLSKAKDFDVNHGAGLSLGRDKIYEFDQLNSSLMKMTEKIAGDYRSLKEFTENASHEIQTPLALINGRVEELIQSKEISGEGMKWLQDIHESTMRLSRLNQALLLLARMDNGQFYEREPMDLGAVMQKRITEQEEIFGLKEIRVTFEERSKFVHSMHPILTEVLLTNLLNNAVKHNIPHDGIINVVVYNRQLMISNTGTKLLSQPDSLFQRFKKGNPSSSSLGLGLAIVKKICEISHLDINYSVEDDMHTICVSAAE